MSQYSRGEFNANAGIVVGVGPQDFPGDALAGVEFQRLWEQRAFAAGGGTYAAPAQRVADFLAGRASIAIGTILPSYRPSVVPADLAACAFRTSRLPPSARRCRPSLSGSAALPTTTSS
jgi:uncharacterized FAD-dependent dehydrogenase